MKESQLKAMERYRNKHPDKIRHIRNKSATKSFIRRDASTKELLELEEIIIERLGRDGRGN